MAKAAARPRTLDDLKPDPNNPRAMEPEPFDGLKTSLGEFGDISGITWNAKTGELVGGHQRLRALQELYGDKLKLTAKGIVTPTGEVFPVEVKNWTREKQRMANITANNPGVAGAFDESAEALLLATQESAPEMFKSLRMDTLLETLDVNGAGSSGDLSHLDEDEDDESGDELWSGDVVVSEGDLWTIGPHRIVCGSALDEASWLLLGEQGGINLIVTSPPYNQDVGGFKNSAYHKSTGAGKWIDRMSSAYEDAMPEDEYQSQQVEMLNTARAHSRDDSSMFYNHKIRYRNKTAVSPRGWVDKSEWNVRQEIVWKRSGTSMFPQTMFMCVDERIYWLTSSKAFAFNSETEIKTWSTVWDIFQMVDVKISAPFPAELPRRCILACSSPGDIVMDPYLGSGTTLVVSNALDRECWGMDISPLYVQVSLKRLAREIGEDAVREGDGFRLSPDQQ